MNQPDWGFWIFISLTFLFLFLQALDSYVSHRNYRVPDLVCLGFAMICGIVAFMFHVLASGVGT